LAESLYGRAISAATASEGEVDLQLLTRLSLGRAESLIELGRHREAADPANDARSLATRTGDEHLEARALLALGRIESDVGDDLVARRLLLQALASFEAVGDVGGQAWANHRLSEAWSREDYTRELEHMRQAYLLFEQAGDRWGRAVAVQDLAYLLTTVGGEEFHHWHQRARRLVEGESDLRSRAATLRTWGYFSYFCGAYGEAIRAMREVRPIAIEAGHRYTEADTFLIEAMAASLVAPPKEAGRLAAEVVRMGRAIGSVRIPALGLAAGARACLRAGDPSRATRQLSAARRTLQRSGARMEMLEVDFVDAGIQLDRGNWRRVAGPAERGAARVRASGWTLYEAMEPLLVGRALLGAGRFDEASGELEQAVESAQAAGATGTFVLAAAALDQVLIMAGRPPAGLMPEGAREIEVEAIVAESDGLVALFEGRTEAATAAFALAVQRWQQLGSRSGRDVPCHSKQRRCVGSVTSARRGGFAPEPAASSTVSRPQSATGRACLHRSVAPRGHEAGGTTVVRGAGQARGGSRAPKPPSCRSGSDDGPAITSPDDGGRCARKLATLPAGGRSGATARGSVARARPSAKTKQTTFRVPCQRASKRHLLAPYRAVAANWQLIGHVRLYAPFTPLKTSSTSRRTTLLLASVIVVLPADAVGSSWCGVHT
jgi:tetratricopeptide (TPR) repeat protein